ncbi:MAG: hypothetical protein HY869_17785 [Chloroflexi bacterium]|nr:hypothetical protein [Chloroflexota bacterium]
MNRDVSGLIVEGICGAGKTALVHALTQSAPFVQKSYLSSIVISEHHTSRILEQKLSREGLVPADHLEVLEFYVQFFEQVSERSSRMDWSARNRTNHRFPFLLERFHLTHVFHYGLDWEYVRPIDVRLAKLNCKLCILEVDEADMEQRIILERNNAGWQQFLRQFGNSNLEIVEYYKKQQELLFNLLPRTRMEWLKINTSRACMDEIVPQVLSFWDI